MSGQRVRCLLKGRNHFSWRVRSMVSVAVSKFGKTELVFLQPGAKINSVYYCENVLEQGLLPAICCRPRHHFQRPWMSLTLASRSRHYLMLNISEMVSDADIVSMEWLIGICRWKQHCVIDHIWLSIGKCKIKIGKYRNYSSYLVPRLKCLTLNNILTGHSRSLKMVPFKSLGKVFYSRSIVTMCVSCIISEI